MRLSEKGEIGMPRAKVHFTHAILDSQEYGSDNEHTVSRVFFSVEINGKAFNDLYVEIRQTPGSDFEKYPLAISAPHGYDGPFSANNFRPLVETYYRQLIGQQGRMINIQNARDIRMFNCQIRQPYNAEFEI
jgi:hypothetical protein